MANVNTYLNRATEEAKQIGAEFIGSLINLNVSLFNPSGKVPLKDIRRAILDDPRIPDEWAPDALNKLSIYVKAVSELGRVSMSKFILPQDEEFNIDDFGGYVVKRLKKRQEDDIPTIHRVCFIKSVEDNDIEIDSSIKVILHRTFGNHETDKTGESEFQIKLDTDDCSGDDFVYFKPFLSTLNKLVEERNEGYYEGAQIRELVLNVLHNHVHVETVNNGLYFVYKDKIDAVNALCERLSQLDNGIRLLNIPVMKAQRPDSIINDGFRSVSGGITESLVKDARLLLEELQNFSDGETKTQARTWVSRGQMLEELRGKLKEYKSKEMILSDVLEETLNECRSIIVANV